MATRQRARRDQQGRPQQEEQPERTEQELLAHLANAVREDEEQPNGDDGVGHADTGAEARPELRDGDVSGGESDNDNQGGNNIDRNNGLLLPNPNDNPPLDGQGGEVQEQPTNNGPHHQQPLPNTPAVVPQAQPVQQVVVLLGIFLVVV